MKNKKPRLRSLGKKVTSFEGFDTFLRPANTVFVSCISDEITANCPVTNQPDWYLVEIRYMPDELCIESKSLKLYLHSFRNEGMFCEEMGSRIATHIMEAVEAYAVAVAIKQKSRGGVSIVSRSYVENTTKIEKYGQANHVWTIWHHNLNCIRSCSTPIQSPTYSY